MVAGTLKKKSCVHRDDSLLAPFRAQIDGWNFDIFHFAEVTEGTLCRGLLAIRAPYPLSAPSEVGFIFCEKARHSDIGVGRYILSRVSLLQDDQCTTSDWSFFFQAEDGIRDKLVTGVQTCALPIS